MPKTWPQSWESRLSGVPLSRRRFLTAAVTLFTGLWGLLTLVPVYLFLRPNPRQRLEPQVRRVTLDSVASMPRNSGKNFDFGGTPAVLVHQADGSFAAYNAICTHLGCTVQYKPELQRIWCACHGGQYDPATGKNVAGPPPRPLEAYRVKTKGSGLVVSLAAEDASGS